MEEKAIRAEELTKYYGDFLAVDRISFSIRQGEIFGFLGPNGAGKTTTVRMLTGILPPSRGRAYVMGCDIRTQTIAAKEYMGIVPETANTYLDLTARENMHLMGSLYGMTPQAINNRTDLLLDRFGLEDEKDQKTSLFSKGMRQKVVLCSALLHDPMVIFLDEPTSGLDVQSTRLIREIILELKKEGRTVFLMTHNIEEANQLCDRVAVIHRGEIAAIDTPSNLRQTFESSRSVEVTLSTNDDGEIGNTWHSSLSGVNKVESNGNYFRFYTDELHEVVKQILNRAEQEGLTLESVDTLSPSLEDVFVRLTDDSTDSSPELKEAK